LLQFHIAHEDTKFGLNLREAETILSSSEYLNMKNIRIVGVMGMASFTHIEKQIRQEFACLKEILKALKSSYFQNSETFNQCSMGMSGDYLIAMEEGSTMVRIGSTIFGDRN
jgi:uncharacterized pyridoxal phosphate-containing UPF0001 family protein